MITHKNIKSDFSNTEFKRVIEVLKVTDDSIQKENFEQNQQTKIKELKTLIPSESKKRNIITLVPMKTLSLEDFKFPFSSATKIRDALKLQVMPYSSAGNVELFPITTVKKGKESNGFVFYVSPEELSIPEQKGQKNTLGKILPAPLPFISKLADYNGSGVTMWIDENNVSSLLWQNNKPILSRWKKYYSDETINREISWYDSYCEQKELERGGNFIINVAGDNEIDEANKSEFLNIISESFKTCTWLSNVNLSQLALEGARGLERTVKFLTKVALILAIAGGISLAGSLLNYQHLTQEVQKVRSNSESLYREVFDKEHRGRIANPVSLARDKIASIKGNSNASVHGLDEVLENLGSIFADEESLKTITIDIIRYNSEGLDCTGSAPDMTTILNFRKAWENIANHVQLDNTQSVSGIGYRFDLRIRW